MSKLKESLGELFLGTIIFTVLLFYFAFTGGLVVDRFCEWFIEPKFIGGELSYLEAVGISCVISLFKNNPVRGVKEEYATSALKHGLLVIALPWLTLFSGYIINLAIN